MVGFAQIYFHDPVPVATDPSNAGYQHDGGFAELILAILAILDRCWQNRFRGVNSGFPNRISIIGLGLVFAGLSLFIRHQDVAGN